MSDINSKISIIIIARNEPLIEYTLRSLELQTTDPYEVIIVVDSPDDMSASIANNFADRLPIRIVLNDIRPGYGGARRKGVEIAKGSILAFIDADVLAPPWWLSRIVRDLEQSYVVAGPGVFIKRSELYTIVNNLLEIHMPSYCKNSYTLFALTQNFAFRRSVLEIIGNFDERFDTGGEDYDFCLRLKKTGISILHDSCAYVFHVEHKRKLKKAWRNGRARAKVFLKHSVHAIRDAAPCFFHGFALLSLPLIIALSTANLSPLLFTPIAISLAHRLYRAAISMKQGNGIFTSLLDSFIAYVSYVSFVISLLGLI
jgi:glycosyltransferase involved in cell wall biosynthesis